MDCENIYLESKIIIMYHVYCKYFTKSFVFKCFENVNKVVVSYLIHNMGNCKRIVSIVTNYYDLSDCSLSNMENYKFIKVYGDDCYERKRFDN
jgi:hypothetical protein